MTQNILLLVFFFTLLFLLFHLVFFFLTWQIFKMTRCVYSSVAFHLKYVGIKSSSIIWHTLIIWTSKKKKNFKVNEILFYGFLEHRRYNIDGKLWWLFTLFISINIAANTYPVYNKAKIPEENWHRKLLKQLSSLSKISLSPKRVKLTKALAQKCLSISWYLILKGFKSL